MIDVWRTVPGWWIVPSFFTYTLLLRMARIFVVITYISCCVA